MATKKKKTVRATKITPVLMDGTLDKADETIDVSVEKKTQQNFQKLCMDVSEVLRSESGTKLSCRVKVLVEDSSAVIYQGMLSNVWGRIKADGRHAIYRHALKQVLIEDTRTKHLCD
jgi:hypothetical protein